MLKKFINSITSLNRVILFGLIGLAIIIASTILLYDADRQGVEPTKVGFVYLTSPDAHGWTYAHEVGRRAVDKHFGNDVKTIAVENVPEGPDATRVIRELAQQGAEIIFTTSFGYVEQTIKVAKEFPDVKFESITGYKRSENVATGSIRFYEGRYVEGVVAGLTTKSGKIGYIASFPIPEVLRGINSFARGLRSVNPDATISVIWVNAWNDYVKEADATKVHIAEGADVFAQHTNSAAMLQIAQKNGLFGFGKANDMSNFGPKSQLFAAINNWGAYYIDRVEAIKNGTWETGDTWGGIDSDMLRLSPFRNMPDHVAQKAQEALDGIRTGSITIFEGPMADNRGNQILKAGEALTDADLQEMSYYIEGVNGSVPN